MHDIPAGWFIKAVNLEAPVEAAAPDILRKKEEGHNV